MNRGVFITGTDTGVGKTLVTACLTAFLREKGVQAIPFKPIQSGAIKTQQGLLAEDVAVYRQILDLKEEQNYFCTYALEEPVSPHLAAKKANVHINLFKIQSHFHRLLECHDFVIVEGAGGMGVPLFQKSERVVMTADLIHLLQIPLLIVTQPGLGTINHTLLTLSYAREKGIPVAGILVNNWPDYPTEMERDNIAMIEKICGVPILGLLPRLPEPGSEHVKDLWPKIQQSFSMEPIRELWDTKGGVTKHE